MWGTYKWVLLTYKSVMLMFLSYSERVPGDNAFFVVFFSAPKY